jgi:hypothetical protein
MLFQVSVVSCLWRGASQYMSGSRYIDVEWRSVANNQASERRLLHLVVVDSSEWAGKGGSISHSQ